MKNATPKIGDTRTAAYVPVTYRAGKAQVGATLADLAAYIADPERFVTGLLAHRASGRERRA